MQDTDDDVFSTFSLIHSFERKAYEGKMQDSNEWCINYFVSLTEIKLIFFEENKYESL